MSLDIELPDLEPEAQEQDEPMHAHTGIKRYVQMMVDAWFRTPQRIAATMCVVIACCFLIAWNLQRMSILDELVQLRNTEYALDTQLARLEADLVMIDLESLSRAIEDENDRVFQGFPELAAWAEGFARVAGSHGLTFSYKAHTPHLSPVPDVLEVPVVFEFKATPETADSLFTNAMHLIGRVLRDHWHIDVVATQARGDGQQLLTLSVDAQVWVRDRYGFVDLTLLQAAAAGAQGNLN